MMRIGGYMMEAQTTAIRAILAVARTKRAQSSLEYIMMLSAVSVIIVIALAMIMQLKGAAVHTFFNSSNQSIGSELTKELANLTAPK